MHPIERLRWIARSEGESAAVLASEAAWTLGELGSSEPAAVLTAARRLLDRHPASGPLWWVAARLVAADIPFEAAHQAAAALDDDATSSRIGELLRAQFAANEVVAVAPPGDLAADGLSRARSYRVRAVGDPLEVRCAMRRLGGISEDVTGWDSEELEEALSGASVGLVEVLASSSSLGLVVPSAAALVIGAIEAGVPLWALVGVGCPLPARLAEAAAERSVSGGAAAVVDPSVFQLAVGPSGPGPPGEIMGATTAPCSVELLRRDP